MFRQAPVISTILKRHSGRQFNPERFVSSEQIEALVEAARWAPSCYGEEPWRFVLCNKQNNQEAWEKLLGCLVEFNQGWAKNAPLLIAVVAKNKFTHNGQPNAWGPYDCGAATMNLCNVGVELGLMSHQMGGFNGEAVSKAFGINEDYKVWSVVAVGYEVETPTDLTERKRKPVENTFFYGTFTN